MHACFQIFDGLGNGLSVGITIKDVSAVGVDEEEAGLLQDDRALDHVHIEGQLSLLGLRCRLQHDQQGGHRGKNYTREEITSQTIKGCMNKRAWEERSIDQMMIIHAPFLRSLSMSAFSLELWTAKAIATPLPSSGFLSQEMSSL